MMLADEWKGNLEGDETTPNCQHNSAKMDGPTSLSIAIGKTVGDSNRATGVVGDYSDGTLLTKHCL